MIEVKVLEVKIGHVLKQVSTTFCWLECYNFLSHARNLLLISESHGESLRKHPLKTLAETVADALSMVSSNTLPDCYID